MLDAALLKDCGEPDSVQEAVWLVVSSPAKKKVATSGSSLSSLSGFPVWGSLQRWEFCQMAPFPDSQSRPSIYWQATPARRVTGRQRPALRKEQVYQSGHYWR